MRAALSLPSDPELANHIFDIGTGAISSSFSARSITGPWLL